MSKEILPIEVGTEFISRETVMYIYNEGDEILIGEEINKYIQFKRGDILIMLDCSDTNDIVVISKTNLEKEDISLETIQSPDYKFNVDVFGYAIGFNEEDFKKLYGFGGDIKFADRCNDIIIDTGSSISLSRFMDIVIEDTDEYNNLSVEDLTAMCYECDGR